MADNSITLVGNLTRDPEIRFTATGRAVASFGKQWATTDTQSVTSKIHEAVKPQGICLE